MPVDDHALFQTRIAAFDWTITPGHNAIGMVSFDSTGLPFSSSGFEFIPQDLSVSFVEAGVPARCK
jgi:hypothetical protein